MVTKIITKYQKEGLLSILNAIYKRLNPSQARSNTLIKKIVSSGRGIEIGGISSIFQKGNIIPIYPVISSLDNCNFSSSTVWEGEINKNLKYVYDKNQHPGRQYILEATELYEINSNTYDFLLSSHMLEHTANPIKALKEWKRIIKDEGHLILIVPHKDGTFDHNRPITTLNHLIQDYESNITEKDLTHMNEILELHDISMDPGAGTSQQFAERSEKNYDNRCLHHHVFNSPLVIDLMDYLELQIKAIEAIAPMHILVVVQKLPVNKTLSNEDFIKYVRTDKYKTPFSSDKI